MYLAILFDLDDTLYDLRSYWTGRLQRAFRRVVAQYPSLNADAMVQAALTNKIYMEQMANFLRQHEIEDEAFIAEVSEEYRRNWFAELELAEDALAVFEQLQPTIRLGLVTNGPSSTQRPKIERFGLARYMDVIIVSEEVGVAKPDPAIFRIALEQLGTHPNETLYVGDSLENDLQGATAAGMPFIWVNPRDEPLPEGMPPPRAIIHRLAELPPLVETQVV